jgi:hypothetical protein
MTGGGEAVAPPTDSEELLLAETAKRVKFTPAQEAVAKAMEGTPSFAGIPGAIETKVQSEISIFEAALAACENFTNDSHTSINISTNDSTIISLDDDTFLNDPLQNDQFSTVQNPIIQITYPTPLKVQSHTPLQSYSNPTPIKKNMSKNRKPLSSENLHSHADVRDLQRKVLESQLQTQSLQQKVLNDFHRLTNKIESFLDQLQTSQSFQNSVSASHFKEEVVIDDENKE